MNRSDVPDRKRYRWRAGRMGGVPGGESDVRRESSTPDQHRQVVEYYCMSLAHMPSVSPSNSMLIMVKACHERDLSVIDFNVWTFIGWGARMRTAAEEGGKWELNFLF